MSNLLNVVKALQERYTNDASDSLDEKVQIQLATAIGGQLPIPAVQEGSGKAYYQSMHFQTIRKLVNEINELFVLDVSCVLSCVESIYVARYNFVHAPQLSTDIVNAIVVQVAGEVATDLFNMPSYVRISNTVTELFKSMQTEVTAEE